MDAAEDLAALVLTHERSLLRTAYLLTGDPRSAEDLVHAALATAHRRRRHVAADAALSDGAGLADVRRILVRTHLGRRRRLVGDLTLETLPAEGNGPGADEEELRQALAQLPPRTRAVVVLRWAEELTEAETAGLVGCSAGTVRTEARRGATALARFATDPEPPVRADGDDGDTIYRRPA